MRLIDADAVYKILESCEIKKATIGNPLTDWEDGYTCGIERGESEIDCALTVEAVPVELIKELLTRLRRRRKNLDDDCVDEAWNLTMQMEALDDLLSEWAERKEE